MNLKTYECPNCKAPLEDVAGKPLMFCPYCGTKIAKDDIEFYKEDSKTARLENVVDSVTKIVGTKDQRIEEKKRREEKAEEQRQKSLKMVPFEIAGIVILLLVLFLMERYGA